MKFKLIDAEIALSKQKIETLRFRIRNCQSQQELDNIRFEITHALNRIDDLFNQKAKRLADMFAAKLSNDV